MLQSIFVSNTPKLGKPPYRWFWWKYVDAFNDAEHCQKCLVGQQSRVVNLTMKAGVKHLLEAPPSKYAYLCGSTGDYATNLHVAMIADPGARFTATDHNGTVISICGFSRLPVQPLPLPEQGPYSPKHLRCRNFQFGYQIFGGRKPATKRGATMPIPFWKDEGR